MWPALSQVKDGEASEYFGSVDTGVLLNSRCFDRVNENNGQC